MRVKEHIGGYNLWLTANETYKWAHKAGPTWPCSTLAGHKLFVAIDSNGLCDITLDGKEALEIDSNELEACITDHLPESLHQFWPVWSYIKEYEKGKQ